MNHRFFIYLVTQKNLLSNFRSKEASQRFEAVVQRRPAQLSAADPAKADAAVDGGSHGDDTDSESEAEVTKVTSPSGGRFSNKLKRAGKRSRCRYNEVCEGGRIFGSPKKMSL